MARIGVLALQGGFAPHLDILRAIGHEAVTVREARDFDTIDGLVLPGGESSTQLNLLARRDLESHLHRYVHAGHPILATCAGMILLAHEVLLPAQRSLDALDITVVRNGWGRQNDSFEATCDTGCHPLVFIRAPRITRVGPCVKVLCTFQNEPVLVQQGHITAASFHPELSNFHTIHRVTFPS